MLTASLLHLIAGLLFGALGFRVQVLLFYGAAALMVVTGAALGTAMTSSAAVGHAILALTVVSFGYGVGAAVATWRARTQDGGSTDVKDRLPRLFSGSPWPPLAI